MPNPTPPVFNHGYALLICVDDSLVNDLKLPAVKRDVDAFAGVLASPEHCCYPAENIKIVSGMNATRANILGALGWLRDKLNADVSGNATAVVYYTGHGHRDEAGYYLIPYDVDAVSLRATSLAAVDFSDGINALNPQRLLVLLDCCRAGGIGALAKNVPIIRSAAAPIDGFLAPDSKAISTNDVELKGAKGVAESLSLMHGRTVISSSQGEEKSWVLLDGSMSVFTYYVIQALIGHAHTLQLNTRETAVGVLGLATYLDETVNKRVNKEHSPNGQNPDYKISGQNFPIALVHAGAGYAKDVDIPDANDVVTTLAAAAAATSQSVSGGVGVVQIAGSSNTIIQTVNNTTITISTSLANAIAGVQRATAEHTPVASQDRFILRDELATSFSMSEIKALCFAMGLDFEDIAGDTKSAKVIELIMYCERRGILGKLGDEIHKARSPLS